MSREALSSPGPSDGVTPSVALHLLVIGTNHRTSSLDVRERLLGKASYASLRKAGGRTSPWSDLVLLTTCNRVEVYTLTEGPRRLRGRASTVRPRRPRCRGASSARRQRSGLASRRRRAGGRAGPERPTTATGPGLGTRAPGRFIPSRRPERFPDPEARGRLCRRRVRESRRRSIPRGRRSGRGSNRRTNWDREDGTNRGEESSAARRDPHPESEFRAGPRAGRIPRREGRPAGGSSEGSRRSRYRPRRDRGPTPAHHRADAPRRNPSTGGSADLAHRPWVSPERRSELSHPRGRSRGGFGWTRALGSAASFTERPRPGRAQDPGGGGTHDRIVAPGRVGGHCGPQTQGGSGPAARGGGDVGPTPGSLRGRSRRRGQARDSFGEPVPPRSHRTPTLPPRGDTHGNRPADCRKPPTRSGMTPSLRAGTRGSPLALAQADEVVVRLRTIRPGLRTDRK